MKSSTSVFRWGPISNKQKILLGWWTPSSKYNKKHIIMAHGAVRSGKSMALSTGFVLWAMSNFNNQLFGFSGKTIGSFRQNVLRDLKRILISRGYSVNERRSDKLLQIKGDTYNEFEIFGGKDELSQDLIQGRTLAGMFFDDATLINEAFIKQALLRLSVTGAKAWFNMNPAGPFHFLKIDFLDKLSRKNAIGVRFSLDDNLTLSEEVKNRLKNMHTGLFYKRYILGLWVLAEGVIYDMFSGRLCLENPSNFENYIIGIDYGSSNPCVFKAFGWNHKNKIHGIYPEYYYDPRKVGKQKTDFEFANDFDEWIRKNHPGIPPQRVYIDPSATSLKLELQKRGYPVLEAKNDVIDGIRFISNCLSSKYENIQLIEDIRNKSTIQEYTSYSWDEKASQRGEDKPIKENDHAMDATRYALYSHFGGGEIAYSGKKDKQDDEKVIESRKRISFLKGT